MGKLLLIIDMQEGFRCNESEMILSNILKLIKKFQGKIVFLKFNNPKNSLFEKRLNWTRFQSEDDKKLFLELQMFDYPRFEHSGYTILNDKLKLFLIDNKITKVFLCGIYTDVCIMKAAMDLFDENYETFIIENACNSLHGNKNHNSAIDSLKHILGKNRIIKRD